MNKIYRPLPNIKIDIERLTTEIFHFWKPNPNGIENSTSLTTSEKYIDDLNYDFTLYRGPSEFVPHTKLLKVYSDGEFDQNLIHWPKILQNTYMKELGDYFAKILKVPCYRCRASYYNSLEKDFIGELHNDPQTPYRIHIALKTDPNVKWIFVDKDNKTYDIHQPADNTPVLIETGTTQHQVIVPKNSIRTHIWFQYYNDIDQTLLDKLFTI
jgi:hypothetical protein